MICASATKSAPSSAYRPATPKKEAISPKAACTMRGAIAATMAPTRVTAESAPKRMPGRWAVRSGIGSAAGWRRETASDTRVLREARLGVRARLLGAPGTVALGEVDLHVVAALVGGEVVLLA